MALLNTVTDITFIGNKVKILTYYQKEGESFQEFLILNQVFSYLDGIIEEGFLLRKSENNNDDFFIDENGNLIAIIESGSTYSINRDGELIEER